MSGFKKSVEETSDVIDFCKDVCETSEAYLSGMSEALENVVRRERRKRRTESFYSKGLRNPVAAGWELVTVYFETAEAREAIKGLVVSSSKLIEVRNVHYLEGSVEFEIAGGNRSFIKAELIPLPVSFRFQPSGRS